MKISLRTKIFFLVTGVVVISFVILTMIVSYQTFELAKKDAFNLAEETAEKFQYEIRAELQGARITAETLATVFETLKDLNLTDRTMMNNILKNTLTKKKYITAFGIAYDPDALDGKDKEYAGDPLYDDTGRYAPYWHKFGDNDNIEVEPLHSIDTEDWYIQPKATLQEHITPPYFYPLQGDEVMRTSLVFPILHREKFIGIISSDIILEKLEEMVSEINPYNEDGYTGIFSNEGNIVAHSEKIFLGKDITQWQTYRMLIVNHTRLAKVIKVADEFLLAHPVKDPNDRESVKKHAQDVKFVEILKRYASDFDASKIDLNLLNTDLAYEILKLDPPRFQYVTELKAAIREGTPYTFSGKEFYTIHIPVRFSEVTTPWSVGISMPKAQILNNAHGIRNYVIIAAVVAVCVIAVMLFIVVGNITRPIQPFEGGVRN